MLLVVLGTIGALSSKKLFYESCSKKNGASFFGWLSTICVYANLGKNKIQTDLLSLELFRVYGLTLAMKICQKTY